MRACTADIREDGHATGYTLVLPPGWRQVPVRNGSREIIRQITDDAFRNLPQRICRDKVTPYRIELERRLTAAAASARRHGGTEFYLPVEPVGGVVLAASFVVSEGSLDAMPGVTGIGPSHVLALLAAEGDGGRPVTMDGAAAVRIERVAPPDPDHGIEYASRRVDYLAAIPGYADRWLIFAFSALGAGDPDDRFAGFLVELFDAIMSTFRWAGPAAARGSTK